MTTYSVWAPGAGRVELDLDDARIPMEAGPRGWWSIVAAGGPGTNYAFVVDGGGPRPDPRSPWQPSGVHGPSRVVDHAAFAWSDDGWRPGPLQAAVLYELHVGTFTPEGTFDAAAAKLSHLVELGVDAIEVMPVAHFPGVRGWGYDGVDLYAPHDAYGGPDGFKRFVDAAHSRGLAVLLDVVYNHLGPAGNYLGQFGPYFTDRYGTPWGEAVNLDGPYSDEVRAFFIDNACMWIRDYHLDGLRLDAVHAIYDASALHFLEELGERVHAAAAELGRDAWVIAESDLNDPRLVTDRDRGGYGLDAQWSDDFHHALHAVASGERSGYYGDFGTVGHIAKALRGAFVYDGAYSPYRRRRHGRSAGALPGHRFLGYVQNHDQVGNRARGERLSHLVDVGVQKACAALVLTSPFVPMLFQGEEWGASTPFLYFTDHEDADLGRAVSEGRRREFAAFGWQPEDVPDPQAEATFAASRLDWAELDRAPHRDLLEWHVALLRLRRRAPELRDGRRDLVRTQHSDDHGWIAVRRGRITVACNFSDGPRTVPASGTVVLTSGAAPETDGSVATLEAKSVTIFEEER